ncbi:MAG: hypothetical protein K0Q77_341 [Anaerosporomusa subterranea]|jgi:hypothetical protein|nr:hypothetical protein [Anaerosporomusa subterranea]
MTYNFSSRLRETAQLSDREWASLQFELDPLRGKAPAGQEKKIIAAALACAAWQAEQLLSHYGRKAPSAIAAEYGLKIRHTDTSSGSHPILSTYEPAARIITLYDKALRLLSSALRQRSFSDWQTGSLEEIAIAHELYHHLEEIGPRLFTAHHSIVLWRVGSLMYRSHFPSLSEIGAFHFCKLVCGLSYHPMALSLLALHKTKPAEADTLLAKMTSK